MQPTRAPSARISTAGMLTALGRWPDRPGAMYERLADAASAAIERGDIPRGVRLPAERTIARELRVSRGTVVAAYRLLDERGLVERRHGSGTWVVDPEAGHEGPFELDAAIRSRRLTERFLGPDTDVIDLAVSVLLGPTRLPGDAFRTDVDTVAKLSSGHGYHPLGLPALRERLAQLHTDNGLPTDPSEIAVTLGGQQAIALTAALFVEPGEHVMVETSTFPGAIDAYARAGARFETVAADIGGAQLPSVERAVARGAPRLFYVVPTCHNPTGTVMPEHRREAIATVADANDVWVVEDETLAWTTFDGRRPRSIASYSRRGRVITVGSLSKILWGGLRVGWIRADSSVITKVARLKAAHDLGNCAVSQAIALTLLDDVDRIVDERRSQLEHGARVLMEQLAQLLPAWTFRPPEGGLSLWVRLPGSNAEGFATVALRHGVAVLAGTAASPRDDHADHIRMAFTESDDRLAEAVQRLAAAWAHTGRSAAGATADSRSALG